MAEKAKGVQVPQKGKEKIDELDTLSNLIRQQQQVECMEPRVVHCKSINDAEEDQALLMAKIESATTLLQKKEEEIEVLRSMIEARGSGASHKIYVLQLKEEVRTTCIECHHYIVCFEKK